MHLHTGPKRATRGKYIRNYISVFMLLGLAVQDVGIRPLDCWDCGFESRQSNGSLSLVSVVKAK
jgi:hypothetical protein